MSDFRKKLVALGRGQASVRDVSDALQTLIAERPEAAPQAQQLLDAALKAGMPASVHANLSRHVPKEDDETLFSGADWTKTEVPPPGEQRSAAADDDEPADAGGDATVLEGGDATVMTGTAAAADVDETVLSQGLPGSPDVDATVMSSVDGSDDGADDAAVQHDDDATVFSGPPDVAGLAAAAAEADDDATMMAGRAGTPADDEATVMHPREKEDDATTFNPGTGPGGADGDKTLISSTAIDDAFDILSDDALSAAEDSRRAGGDDDWTAVPSAGTDVEFREGSLLRNRFILEKKLGEGGMGAVWKGVDKLKQEARDRNPYVAIKLLQGDFKDHPEAFIALQRETSKQQRLAHPNIATVFDFDRDDASSTVFMTMEVLSGADLAAHIRKKVPPEGLEYDDAMQLIRQLASGLAYAHSHGLVHSDLKPGNCFVTEENAVKLLDFGIARASKTKESAEGEKTLFDPGELGALTPAYATIEMFDGMDPDPRDDIYAMAIIAYQLFTGKHPYGKKNAPKAEAAGLTVPPVAKLTKAQNRELARGLAFRRDDRTGSVEEFLGGLEPKKSQTWLWATAAAVILALGAAVGGPLVVDYMNNQEREAIIAKMLDPSSTAAAFAEAEQLSDPAQRDLIFADERTRALIVELYSSKDEQKINLARDLARKDEALKIAIESNQGVQRSVTQFYEGRALNLFDPFSDKFDFQGAQAEVEKLKAIFGNLATTAQVANNVTNSRTEFLDQLRERYNQALDAGELLPKDGVEDVFDIRNLVAKLDAQHELLTDNLLPLKAAELTRAAIDEADYDRAAALLKASIEYAPDDADLADLRYQVDQELQRQRNEILVAEIEERLRARESSFTNLAAFQEVFDDLIRLADLAPESPVLSELQGRLTDAFGRDLQQQIADGRFADAEQLLLDYAKLFPLDYLDAQRELLSDAETKAGFSIDRNSALSEAVKARQDALAGLLQDPKFDSEWEIALQVPFKELIALLPAGDESIDPVRRQIADQYIAQADQVLGRRLTSQARSLIARGEAFYPEYAGFVDALGRVAETDAVLARERAEKERVANVGRFTEDVIAKARAGLTVEAESAMGELEKIATSAESEELSSAKEALSTAYVGIAETVAGRKDWGQALKLVDRGLELNAANDLLIEARKVYEVEYQKVRDVELMKETLQGSAPLQLADLTARLQKVRADFPQEYQSRYQDEFNALALARFRKTPVDGAAELKIIQSELSTVRRLFGDDTANAASNTLDQRIFQRAKELEPRNAELASSYQKQALAFLPQAERLKGLKIRVASKDAARGLELAKAGQLTAAADIWQKVRANEPNASNLESLQAAVSQGQRRAESQFAKFKRFADRRLEHKGKRFLEAAIKIWKDNDSYKQRLARIAKPGSRYACTPNKAGKGSRRTSTCYDNFSGSKGKGPIMVVVPGVSGKGPYAIGKMEVSVADYNLFCKSAGSCTPLKGDGKWPATGISAADVTAYASWLSSATGATYRLPTETEWEHAARAAGKQPKKGNYNCTVMLNNRKIKGQSARSVLSGPTNGWGLQNYIGNVREMATSGGNISVRGGSYEDPMDRCKATLRDSFSGNGNNVTGFRLVRELG